MLKLHTFGSLSVYGAHGRLAGATAQPRRLAVLAVLARGGRRGAARGKLLGLLWPDASDEQGRRVITQAVYALRRDLGLDDAIVGTQELRLNDDVVWCDAVEFEAAVARGDLSQAATVYVGPFLEGFRLPNAPEFGRWADDERLAFQHRYRATLDKLARDAETRGAWDDAVRWWRRRVSEDPLSSPAALSLMRALAATGDRAEAIRHARLFEALMAEDLGLPPDREVIALAKSLQEPENPREQLPQEPSPNRAGAAGVIAVLPFAVLGRADLAAAYSPWCDELAEELIGVLVEVPRVKVMARAASFAQGPNPSLAWLRNELRVTHAVEGSVQRGRAGLRLNIRLVACDDGHIVWWEKFDVPIDDAGARHDAIASCVADRVRDLEFRNEAT